MKLKDLCNKFIRKPARNTSEGISLLKSYIVLIDRKKEKNESVIARLDGYKESFLRVLNSKWTTYSGDFDMKDIDYKKNLYNEVFLNIFDKEKVDLFDKREKAVGEELCSTLCMLARLSAYRADILEAIEETRERLTALTEISDENVFLRASKRRSLNEAINGLESSYLLFTNHLYMIKRALMKIHQDYLYFSEDEECKNAQSDLIEEKRRELESMVEAIGSKRLDFYRSIDQSLVAIAKMKQELDEYVYVHRNEVKNISVQVDSLDAEETDTDKLLARFSYYEMLYKIFSIYGRNLVRDEDLALFYDKKFTIKIKNVLSYSDGEIVKGASFLEIECYERRILNALYGLTEGDALGGNMLNSFKLLIDDDSTIEVLRNLIIGEMRRLIMSIFDVEQCEEGEERAWRILNNRKLLSLLFAFERKDGLTRFFNDFLVKTASVQDVDLHTEIYNWAPAIPLESVYLIKSWNKFARIKDNPYDKCYELYGLYKRYTDFKFTILPGAIFPEGITNINCNYICRTLSGSLGKSEKYFKMLRYTLSKPISIRFPSSLKSIQGPLFSELKNLDIVLNDNLCVIGDDVFIDAEIDRLSMSANANNNVLSRFNTLLDMATVDVVCLTDYNSEVGIPPSFIQGFFKAEFDKSEYIGEDEYVLSKMTAPRFKILEVCCGDTTIRVSADYLRYSFKRIKVGTRWVFDQSTDISYSEAREIAYNLTQQIDENLGIGSIDVSLILGSPGDKFEFLR